MILRPYQHAAIVSLRSAYAAGRRAPILCAPTGSGKTVIAAEIIRGAVERGNRVLVLAHRTELITQTQRLVPGARIISAGSDTGGDAPVVIASVQTLTRWTEMPPADLIIADECHHFRARTFARILAAYPNARRLGLSATPCRGDNQPLSEFDCIVPGPSVAELTALGCLVPCTVYAPSRTLEPGEIATSVAEAYAKHGEGRRAVVFCASVDHARQVAADLGGVVVHGEMRADDRAAALASRPRVLCSVAVLTEGWDDPEVAVCILTRAPQHVGTYLQMIGRVLRPYEGKRSAVLIDLAGAVHLHGTPDADRTYALTGKAIRTDRVPLAQCLACGMVRIAGSACPCGHVGAGRDMTPEVVNEQLGAIGSRPPRPMKMIEIKSRFASKCGRCAGRISVGETVVWKKNHPAIHRSCA